ncbi:MAG: YggT family protein [Bacillota bacterium]|nr:YggT family protein [Bacillota bacterium]MDW7684634.1 YggT family protein [Bacillota bacterium]
MEQAIPIANLFFTILRWLILVRVILSWIPHNPNHPLLSILYEGTEPILGPIRRLMPKTGLPFDLSPIIAIIVLGIVHNFVINLLVSLL